MKQTLFQDRNQTHINIYQGSVWAQGARSHCGTRQTGVEWRCGNCRASVQNQPQRGVHLSEKHDLRRPASDTPGSCLAAAQRRTKPRPAGNKTKTRILHCLLSQHTPKSGAGRTWHCPGGIVPLDGSVLKCANLRKQKLTGSWGQRFCRTQSRSRRWPVTQVGKLNL